jgi:transcriptional regulator with XRE-family HTH domain
MQTSQPVGSTTDMQGRSRPAGWAMMAKRTREKAPVPGSLGAIVRAERQQRGWSQEELAARAGLDQHDVSRVETGKSRLPQEKTMSALAQALDIPLGLLYERANYPELSYQIPPLREELKTLGVDEQTVITHLARFLRENADLVRDHDPEEITAFFAQAVTTLRECAPRGH